MVQAFLKQSIITAFASWLALLLSEVAKTWLYPHSILCVTNHIFTSDIHECNQKLWKEYLTQNGVLLTQIFAGVGGVAFLKSLPSATVDITEFTEDAELNMVESDENMTNFNLTMQLNICLLACAVYFYFMFRSVILSLTVLLQDLQ